MPDAQRHAAGAPEEARVTGAPGQDWPAPAATMPVRAVVTLPGSKSITNRALVLAALADGPGLIRRPLRARDTLLMAAALRALGADVEEHAGGAEDAAGAEDAGGAEDAAQTRAARRRGRGRRGDGRPGE